MRIYSQCSSGLLGALMSLLFIVHPHEIEVGNLGVEVLVQKYIVRLQISVDDPLVVKKPEAASNSDDDVVPCGPV